MRVVTYARVSTLRQESEGESLPNQERAFARWLDATGHERLAAYQDAASGGTIEGRTEFRHMIADLPRLRPDAVVVDTLDRFTRNLRDGLNILEELRGHNVGLLPLDWRRTAPLDIDDDRDWADVVDEFSGAERERRRIRRRVVRSYEGRRERGATTTNCAPFGTRRHGDHLVASDDAWIIAELDRRFLSGETLTDLARWIQAAAPTAWRSIAGIRKALASTQYVVAGVREPGTQAAIAHQLQMRGERFNQARVHEHEFSGVFACGKCLQDGRAPSDSLMSESVRKKGAPQVVCQRRRDDPTKVTHFFKVATPKVRDLWLAYIDGLTANPALIDAWAAGGATDEANRARSLQQRLAKIDQEAAAIKARRDAAFDLLNEKSEALRRQAKRLLAEIDADEMQLALTRQTVLGELARSPVEKRDAAALRRTLERYREIYESAPLRTRNELNRMLCQAIGSHPQLYRIGRGNRWLDNITMLWPEIDALKPLPASSLRSGPSPR